MLEMIRTVAREDRGGRHDRQVLGIDGLQAPEADAVDPEDALGEDRAGQQDPELDAEDGHHRHQRRAQGVLVDDRALRQALGPRGADVVLTQGLHHRAAGVPRVRGAAEDAQRDPGQEHPGEPLGGVVGEREVAGVGEERYLPLDGQEQPHQQGEEVVGHRADHQEAGDQRLVGHGAASSRGGDADGDAEQEVEGGAADRHGERGRDPLLHLLEDGDLGAVGVAEAGGRALVDGRAAELDVAADEDALHELAVLLVPRVVEAEVLLEVGQPLRRAPVAGVAVADRLGGARGALEEQQEDAQRDEEDDDDPREQPLDDVGEHAMLIPSR